MRHQRLNLLLNVLLVLVAALLGIVTNYATSETGNSPALLDLLQKVAVPAIGVLILVLILGHIVAFRLENPPAPRREWDPARTPYPGLEAFQEDEAAVFLGREMQIDELVRRLHTDGRHRFVVVAGASGSGKSSLVQAGFIPWLRGRRWIVLPVMTPGNDPMGALHAVAWSPDGTRIATASYDRTVRIWDARTHVEIGVVGVHRDKVTSVTWISDSARVITGSFDGTVRAWKADVDLEALKAAARARVFRSLTEDERRAHMLPVSDQ